MAGFREKLFAVQVVLGGHLRQQQTTSNSLLHDQAMLSNLNVLGMNSLERRKQGNLNFRFSNFLRQHACEPRILKRRGSRTSHNAFAQRIACIDHSNASTQFPLHMQGDKHTTSHGKDTRKRERRQQPVVAYGFG